MKTLVVFAVVLLCAAAAFGAPIPGLYNTGADASNVALTGADGAAEINYVVTGFSPVTYKHEFYLANTSTARWISSGGDGSDNNGIYVRSFLLTFTLDGFNPSTASITGNWAADNCGTIYLNGVSTGEQIGAGGCIDYAHFQQPTTFTILSGFVAGTNVLEFRLENQGGPGALFVDGIVGDASGRDILDTPEPATMGLMGAALAGLALLRRRK